MLIGLSRRPAAQGRFEGIVRAAFTIVLVALAVYLLARLGYTLVVPNSQAQFFWPPAGIVLALLVLSDKQDWPCFLIGAFVGGLAGDILGGNLVVFGIAAAFINLTQSFLAAWLLTTLLGSPVTLSSLRSVIVLVGGAAIACTAVGAALGAALLHHIFHEPFGRALVLWGVGNGAGILVITPALLTWAEAARSRQRWRPSRIAEAALLFPLTAASGCFLLSADHGSWLADSHAYLTLPLLLWAALRFGPTGAATGSFILGSILTWSTAQGHGVFTLGGQSPLEQSLQIYIYVAFASLSALLPAVMFRERQATEHALLESRQLYKTVTDTASDAIISFDQDSVILFANPGVHKTFGYTPSEMEGKSLSMVIPECLWTHHRETIRETIQHFEKTGRKPGTWSVVARQGLHRNGATIPLEASFGGLFSSGRYIFTSIMRDVSERELAEQALHESRERYQLLFESNPHPMWVCDRKTLSFLEVNDVAVAQYGYSRDEFLKMRITDIRLPEDIPNLMEKLSAPEQESSYAGQSRHRRKDGTLMDVEVFAHAIELDGRDVSVVAAHDVTEKRMIAKQMASLQKYDAIGKLAGGIAHDFNNLLAVILGWAEIARDQVEEVHPVREGLDRIIEQSERASRLTRQLLAFARQQILERRHLSLNEVINDSLDLLRNVAGEHVDVQVLLSPALAVVRADQSQLEQVLLNLVVNARDAMPRGGQILLETTNTSLDEEFCETHIWALPGQYVRLSVSDGGVGMDKETLEHIFDPFFTTKKVGKGTGLGLATVYGIVKQHEGFIHAYSEPACGATFRIYIPAGTGEVKGIERRVEPTVVGGRETILLVDDHDALRAIAQLTLRRYGYTVLEACNGQEALQLFRENIDRIDLVVSDVVMPKMSGPASVKEMCAERPNLLILFTTGYSVELQMISEASRGDLPILQKPYGPRSLAARVRELLDKGPNRTGRQIH